MMPIDGRAITRHHPFWWSSLSCLSRPSCPSRRSRVGRRDGGGADSDREFAITAFAAGVEG